MSGKKSQGPRPSGKQAAGVKKSAASKPKPKPPAGKPSMRSGNPQSNKKK